MILLDSDSPGPRVPEPDRPWLAGAALVLFLIVLFVLLPLLVGPAAAQTLGPRVDKATFSAEGISFWPFELDGDMATSEWLGLTVDPQTDRILYRAATVQGGQFCVGQPFDPVAIFQQAGVVEFTFAGLFQVQGRYRFVFQGPRYYQELAIAVPVCGVTR